MPLTATSPAARADWLERHALPKAQKIARQRLGAKPMADLLGVSWNTLKKWIRDEVPGFEASGAFEPGDRGQSYSFKPVATVRFLIKHFRSEADARAAKARQVRTAIGGAALADVPLDMTLDDIRKATQVRAEMIRQAEREGRLVDYEVVTKAVDAMIASMSEAAVRAAREQDPTGRWPPEITEKFENAVESIMVSVQAAGAKCLDDLERGRPVA